MIGRELDTDFKGSQREFLGCWNSVFSELYISDVWPSVYMLIFNNYFTGKGTYWPIAGESVRAGGRGGAAPSK